MAVSLVLWSISLVAFAQIFSWGVAAGLMGVLWVHEMGHVVALRKRRIRASPPLFIPFLGAVVVADEAERAVDDAWIGLAGPLAGGVASVALAFVGELSHSGACMSAGQLGLALNLANLIPLRPLDGGRAASLLHPGLKVLGIVLLGLIAVCSLSGLVFAVIVAALALVAHRQEARGGHPPGYHACSARELRAVRLLYGALFVGMATAMVALAA